MLTHIIVDNVRQAYAEALPRVHSLGDREESRNGPVFVMPGPLVTSYRRPDQRVLVDPARDANPYFHLMEALWMLAGRRDVESLMRYNSGMKKYSDDGVTFHGAYGWRWRSHFAERREQEGIGMTVRRIDQLEEIVRLLRENRADRRIVLQMWDPVTDLGQDGLDFPCNNLCYFRVRDDALDMTITCRSNDMLWGGYGANAVHFSVLQEFVAAMVGVRVGEMHQISNNAHLYEATLPPALPLAYDGYPEPTTPLFWGMESAPWDQVSAELDVLWDDDVDGEVELIPASTIQLVGGMRRAWEGWKVRDYGLFTEGVGMIPHEDWHRACAEWGDRRREKFS